jgi:hypothetical protein
MGITAFLTGILFWIATLFHYRVEDETKEIADQGDELDPYNDAPVSPKLEIFYTDKVEPYHGHLFHEVKVDLAGRIYFKIGGKWEVQKNIDEIGIYNIITGEKMAEGFKKAIDRASK